MASCWANWVIDHSGKKISWFIPSMNKTMTFNIDEEIEWELKDGSKQKSLHYWEGDRLMRSETTKSGLLHVVVMEINDGLLIKTMSVGDVVCVRKWKKADDKS